MNKKRTAAGLLFLLFSLLFSTAAYAEETEQAEEKTEVRIPTAEIETLPEDPEALYGDYIPVLMYHHFAMRDMGEGNGVVTSAAELEDHLKTFKEEGYTVISLERLDKILESRDQKQKEGKGLGLPKKYLCITMDDGYYSNYEFGYPLFQKYRTPASIFAVTDFITNRTGITKFTWKQAQEMEDGGYVKIYSHTSDHVPVQEGMEEDFLLSVEKSEEALAEHLKQKDEKVKAIAYPNGRYTEASQQGLEEMGYRLQFTVENGVITNETPRDRIPRITVASGMDGADVVRKIELTAEEAFAAEEGA